MLEAIIKGEEDTTVLAEFAKFPLCGRQKMIDHDLGQSYNNIKTVV
ncbi:MAG: hypothetical protein PHT78_04110 [Desulfitobacteriaceae bacterium]|nr:hypothetical protein [Desulfitobacteriaceae bacterium]MDD4752429.1 hypothetical protein [Desulfitobacteriaceae bacterium]